jgi:hypothetical protein
VYLNEYSNGEISAFHDRRWLSSGMSHRCYRIALLMDKASTYATSVNLYQTTRRNIPEDSHRIAEIRNASRIYTKILKATAWRTKEETINVDRV